MSQHNFCTAGYSKVAGFSSTPHIYYIHPTLKVGSRRQNPQLYPPPNYGLKINLMMVIRKLNKCAVFNDSIAQKAALNQ